MVKFIVAVAMFGIALAVFIVVRVKEWRYSKKKWAIEVDGEYFSLVTKLEIDSQYKCVIFYDMCEEEYRCISFRNIRGYEVERAEVCNGKSCEEIEW